jgi:hypothetical protein
MQMGDRIARRDCLLEPSGYLVRTSGKKGRHSRVEARLQLSGNELSDTLRKFDSSDITAIY